MTSVIVGAGIVTENITNLSSLLENGGTVSGFECVGISNPKFYEQLTNLVL